MAAVVTVEELEPGEDEGALLDLARAEMARQQPGLTDFSGWLVRADWVEAVADWMRNSGRPADEIAGLRTAVAGCSNPVILVVTAHRPLLQ